jgi:hypothetical protein
VPKDFREPMELEAKFRVESAVQKVGAEWVMPLRFLKNPALDGTLRSTERVAPLDIWSPTELEDEIEIRTQRGTAPRDDNAALRTCLGRSSEILSTALTFRAGEGR